MLNIFKKEKEKVLLIIRDGWGYREEKEKNFIKLSNTSFTDKIEKKYPTLHIGASGHFVGLPDDFMGNSEVGHMTIGAGKILEQSLLRINNSIKKNEFQNKEELISLFQNSKRNFSKTHFIILAQKAGVHSHLNHLFTAMEVAKKEGLEGDDLYLHIITDGRDGGKIEGLNFLKEIEAKIKELKLGKIVTIAGRYYTMDRNSNWDRTEKYYNCLFAEKSHKIESFEKYLEENYKKNITDEFIEPAFLNSYEGLENGDSVFFLNFRKDRPRQITKALIEPDFQPFKTKEVKIYFLSMTRYYKNQSQHILFEDLKVENVLGEILEKNSKTQLRIAETEKFAHVTFFFDGGVKRDFKRKTEIIIPSPDVATYDLKPEMSAREVTSWTIQEIKNNKPDFIVLNYANPDMVGHTGNFDAIKKAVETVDKESERLVKIAKKFNYQIILTGDHGNVEDKREKTLTSHTTNPVPISFIFNKKNLKKIKFEKIKGLADIKKIVLDILKISE